MRPYNIFSLCLALPPWQTLPTGKPNLVKPTLDKVELEALRKDLKKFEENYPARVSRAWTKWVQDVDKLLELPVSWDWPLDILMTCSKVRPATEDVTIPAHLQALRDKETQETQQVRSLLQCQHQVVYNYFDGYEKCI